MESTAEHNGCQARWGREAGIGSSGRRHPNHNALAQRTGNRRTFAREYRESDLDLICRWMEREGMYYYFEHGKRLAAGPEKTA